MSKQGITKRALQKYHSYNTKYFPMLFARLLFENSAPFFNLWMSSEIITALYEGKTKNEIVLLVAITLVGNLFIGIMGAVLSRAVDTQKEILDNNAAMALNRKTLSLDYDKMEQPDIRQHRRKITENSYINGYGLFFMRNTVEAIMMSSINVVFSVLFFAEMLTQMISAGIQPLSLLLLAGLVGSVALNFFFSSVYSKKMGEGSKEVGDRMLEENRFGNAYSPDGLDNRMYHQQLLINEKYEGIHKTHLQVVMRFFGNQARYRVPVLICGKLMEAISYLIVCFYCVLGTFPIGSLIKYVGYLGKLTGNVQNILFVCKEIKTNEPFLEVYLDYFDIPNDMYQGSLAVEKRSDKKFDIEFKDVSFRYSGANEDALKHINLKLKVGERLAVVGKNGSGKTTFIKLLCRLYDPKEGEIFMNDFNVRKYDYRQYLDLFSVVFQDYNLLAVPLGNNVASSATWDTEKAERLLSEVGFGERYADMPKKLETPIYKNFDEDGVNVSGGEAQKIALARALYKDAPFIILDEPTAALDPIAEAEIYAKFDEIVGDKTAIYISHRLSSCRFCDKIAVFDEGRIVQIGTHEELLADTDGLYYELWNAQAQYYVQAS